MRSSRRAAVIVCFFFVLVPFGFSLATGATAGAGIQGPTWTVQTSGTSNDLLGVTFIDDYEGWAVGENATILHTTDGGTTWTKQAVPNIVAHFHDVSFVNSQEGWVVGGQGVATHSDSRDGIATYLLRTQDGGKTWTKPTSWVTGTMEFSGVHFLDSLNGFMAGLETCAYTTDGGATLTRISLQAGDVWSPGSGGAWFAGKNGGLSESNWWLCPWGNVPTVDAVSGVGVACLFGITGTDASHMYAVGRKNAVEPFVGVIARSTDGIHWSEIPVGQRVHDGPLYGVSAAGTNVWAVGSTSVDLSSDAGQTWSTITSKPNALNAVWFNNSSTGWVVGDGGLIMRTDNGSTPDDAAPTTTTSGIDGLWHNRSLSATLSAVDAGSGVAYTQYRVNGGSWVPSTTVAEASDGDYLVEYRSADWAANVEALRSFHMRIDTVKPTTTAPVDNAWHQADFSFPFSPSDALSGIAYTEYTVDGGATARGSSIPFVAVGHEGVHAVAYHSVDNAGNTEATKSTTVKIDADPPVTKTDYDGLWHNSDVLVNLSATDHGSGVAKTQYQLDGGAWTDGTSVTILAPATHLKDGLHTLAYRSTDVLGHVETTKSVAVKIDTRAPVTTNTTPTTWQKTFVVPTFTAADGTGGSGIARTECSIDGAAWVSTILRPIISSDGVHTLSYRSTDAAGNTEATRTGSVRIDATPPTVTQLNSTTHPLATSWYASNSPALSWSASDLSGISGYSYVMDRVATTVPDTVSDTTATSRSYSGLAEGVWYFHIRAENGAGLWGATKTRAVRIDKTPPALSSLTSPSHPLETTWYASGAPTFAWSATDISGITGYSFVMDRVATTVPDTVSDASATSRSYTGLADGLWYFHLRARNGAGLWGATRTRAVRIDAVPPAVSSLSSPTHPLQTAWYSSNAPTLTWSAADVSGISGYSYVMDRTSTTVPDTVLDAVSAARSYSGLADGLWYFHVRARNNTGLWGATSTRTVRIDHSAPTIAALYSPTHPNSTTWYANNAPKFAWAAGDISGITGYSYVLDHSKSTVPDTVSDTAATSKSYSGLANGVCFFHLRARNGAGLWGATRTCIVRIRR